MNVLVGCEFSGVVREAFRALGHNAWSCDLLPSEQPGPHLIGDIERYLNQDWDLGLFFPPCTHLAASGARWWPTKRVEQQQAIEFVKALLDAPIPRIALENPIGYLSTAIGKPDQIIQPWQFGHGETKATCLWLKGLPLLQPTNIVPGRLARVHQTPERKSRWKDRSRTYTGIAAAMAAQWGALT